MTLVLLNGIIGFVKTFMEKYYTLKGKMTMLMFYLSMIDEEVDRLNFERIYHKYHDDIFRRTLYILKNQEDAQDAMQETWIGVLKCIKKLRDKDDASIRAYIMKIARNQSVSILRTKRKEEVLMCDIDLADMADDRELFRLCDDQDVSGILACIEQLSDTYSDVLKFYYFYKHSLKEISKLFNISEDTAWTRLRRGKKMLIELLKERGLA